MPNVLQITVESPDDILNTGAYATGALVRLQWSATETGTYADVSGTGSTPTIAVVTGTRSYTGYDPLGIVSTWYRTRFENAGATRLSDWSDPFQVAPEGSGLICSLWDVKQELGITATTDDELLTEKIRQVGALIQLYTGRGFVRIPASGTTTFYFDVTRPGKRLSVPLGIAAATQLEVATITQPSSGGTYSTVNANDWYLRPVFAEQDFGFPATAIEISEWSGSWFYQGHNTVRLTGALGWATVPDDIQAIAVRAVSASYLSKGSGAGGVAAVGPSGAMTVLRFISPADKETLTMYRVIP